MQSNLQVTITYENGAEETFTSRIECNDGQFHCSSLPNELPEDFPRYIYRNFHNTEPILWRSREAEEEVYQEWLSKTVAPSTLTLSLFWGKGGKQEQISLPELQNMSWEQYSGNYEKIRADLERHTRKEKAICLSSKDNKPLMYIREAVSVGINLFPELAGHTVEQAKKNLEKLGITYTQCGSGDEEIILNAQNVEYCPAHPELGFHYPYASDYNPYLWRAGISAIMLANDTQSTPAQRILAWDALMR